MAWSLKFRFKVFPAGTKIFSMIRMSHVSTASCTSLNSVTLHSKDENWSVKVWEIKWYHREDNIFPWYRFKARNWGSTFWQLIHWSSANRRLSKKNYENYCYTPEIHFYVIQKHLHCEVHFVAAAYIYICSYWWPLKGIKCFN